MRKHLLIGIVIALALPAAAAAQASIDITITHPGAQSDLLATGASFAKFNLKIINRIWEGVPNPAFAADPINEPEFFDYTAADVDDLTPTRLLKVFRTIVQYQVAHQARAWNVYEKKLEVKGEIDAVEGAPILIEIEPEN